MPSHENELLRCARTIARLQTQRRKLRRQIKAINANLRLERKHMRALVSIQRDPDVIPSRVFGPGVGLARGRTPKKSQTRDSAGRTDAKGIF